MGTISTRSDWVWNYFTVYFGGVILNHFATLIRKLNLSPN